MITRSFLVVITEDSDEGPSILGSAETLRSDLVSKLALHEAYGFSVAVEEIK